MAASPCAEADVAITPGISATAAASDSVFAYRNITFPSLCLMERTVGREYCYSARDTILPMVAPDPYPISLHSGANEITDRGHARWSVRYRKPWRGRPCTPTFRASFT